MSTIEVGRVWRNIQEITDAVDISHKYYNAGDKTIKYITFGYVAYNSVNDIVACRANGKTEASGRLTGPIPPKHEGSVTWENMWFNPTVSTVKVSEIYVQYMDGTEELIDVQDIVSMHDVKSMYYHEVERLVRDAENISKSGNDSCDLYVSKYKDEDEKVVLALMDRVKISSVKGYCIGDVFEKYFSENKNVMKGVVSFWKKSIDFQQTNFAHPDAKNFQGFPQKYAEKVKKYEPTYVMPKKAGCITFSK